MKLKMTEKNPNPNQKERKAMEKQKKVYKRKSEEKNKKTEEKTQGKNKEQKISEEKKEKPKEIQKKEKLKKTEAIINVKNLPISTKQAVSICKFIKGKEIDEAIRNLGEVIIHKKAIPMKGEIPHRKGIMSGRYPKKASQEFIKLLKSLQANANYNGLENPIIAEATANIGSRPYGRYGRIRRKRTNIKIKVKEMKK